MGYSYIPVENWSLATKDQNELGFEVTVPKEYGSGNARFWVPYIEKIIGCFLEEPVRQGIGIYLDEMVGVPHFRNKNTNHKPICGAACANNILLCPRLLGTKVIRPTNIVEQKAN